MDDVEKRVLVDLVLASATQANAIARACGAARLILTHLSPRADAMQSKLMAEAGFDYPGEVTIGQDLMTIKI